jgi:hypothetical protein
VRDDLERVFNERLLSLIGYGNGRHMAVVASLTPADLAALVPFVARWRAAGGSVPFVVTRKELERTLDIFPIEYARILATEKVLAGADPFIGLAIDPEHMRNACERQVKSHLIHLREGLLETGGRPSALHELVRASSAPFRALLQAVAWLMTEADGPRPRLHDDAELAGFAGERLNLEPAVVRDVLGADRGHPVDAQALMPAYLSLMERLWSELDTWRS